MNRIIAHLTGVLFLVGLFAVGCSGSPPATPTLPPAAASPPVTPTARIERQPSPTALPLPPPADAAPTSLPTEVPNPASTGACTNRYTFVADVSVPDNTPMTPGQVFTKTWRVRNTGTCTWSDGYMLTFPRARR